MASHTGVRAKHKRNRSEPISPEHRAALSAMDRRGEFAVDVSEAGHRRLLAPMSLQFPAFRRPPEWTERSTKMLMCTLAALALVLFTASVSTQQQGSSDTQQPGGPKLRAPVLLHQTVKSLQNATSQELEWRRSWEMLGFSVRLADDSICREDIKRLVAVTGNCEYLAVFDSLETGVQRSDMWRYSALFLYGGVYADTDVVAKPPMAE